MIEQFIPVIGSRKNTLTNATVTGYISAIRHPSDRALICRIADGVDEDYVVANKSIAALLRSIMDDPITIITTARWTSVLVGNKTHPIQRRKPKSVPIPVPAETPSVNHEVWSLLQTLNGYLGGTGEIESFSLKIKTSNGEDIKLKGKSK